MSNGENSKRPIWIHNLKIVSFMISYHVCTFFRHDFFGIMMSIPFRIKIVEEKTNFGETDFGI